MKRLTNNTTEDTAPAWSADGSKIAFFYGAEEDYRMETVKPDGTNRKFITNGYTSNWSPDGFQMAFDRSGEIYEIDADGADEEQLTTNEACDSEPAFSPDGDKIVFSSDRPAPSDGSTDYELYIVDADGTDVRQLTNNSAMDILPDWQPVS